MKKKILLFLVLFFISSSNVMAAGCVSSFTASGSTRRANGHQSQWFNNGSYETTGGSVSDSCFSISGGGSVVNVKASGGTFQFSPQKTGTATVTYTLSASCSCSKKSISKTAYFKFSEWGLNSLEVKGYTLSPKFYNMTMEYTITVPENVNTVDLVLYPIEKGASIKVNGISASAGNVTAQIINNKITILVTTSVGDARTTTISVKRGGVVASCDYSTEEAAEAQAKKECTNYNITMDRSTGCYTYNCLSSDSSSKSTSSKSSSSTSSSKKSSSIMSSKISSDSSDDNPETGSAEMYLIWFLGFAAVGYAVWYYKNVKNMDNIDNNPNAN